MISVALLLLFSAGAIAGTILLLRRESRMARGLGTLALTATYGTIVYFLVEWAHSDGCMSGFITAMAAMVIAPLLVVALLVCAVVGAFRGSQSRGERSRPVLMWSLLGVIALGIVGAFLIRPARAAWYARDLDDPDPSVRRRAVMVLGEMRQPSSVPDLINALDDTDADVREWAVYGLSAIGDRSAAEALRGALSDDSPKVRGAAIYALTGVGQPLTAEALRRFLDDPDKGVRVQVETLLDLTDSTWRQGTTPSSEADSL